MKICDYSLTHQARQTTPTESRGTYIYITHAWENLRENKSCVRCQAYLP